jgi:hypothetical protein
MFFFFSPAGLCVALCVKHVEVNVAASDEGVCFTQVPS